MKSQSKGMLCLLFVCLSFVSVRAQSSLSVCRVALTYYPDRFNGSLMRLPNNTLQFDDDEQRKERILLNRSQVSGKRISANSILLYINQAFIYNGEPRKHLDFLITTASPGCEAIKKWIEADMTTAPIPESAPGGKPRMIEIPPKTRRVGNPLRPWPPKKPERYWVARRRWRGDEYGWLTITDKYIAFDHPSGRGLIQSWHMSEIRNVQPTEMFSMRIEPFAGKKYDFIFEDYGMSRAKFANLITYIRRKVEMSR